ncbi:2-hydroxyacid dehydrogenase [Fodinibius sediminis]|uniref:Glyoxylate/hydroxypyruvate reductase A n=1 Tax=Fodinibius sediminis TaxID=1214077 RepID=A0A521DWF4_9BACT|nr:glyoxylate/hydroxypyruvate reductase A [Fodinibius sediminis]SMO75932.1 glyoxylate/hydroxypyruvate reductase A [Fodinibius sediminis]
MSLLFIAPDRNMSEWVDQVNRIDPNIEIDLWPAIEDKERVQFAVCWNQPSHILDSFPNLKAVSSLGAGVDHLLSDDALPGEIPICRIVSSTLVQQMTEYILGAVISIRRHYMTYLRQKDQQQWQIHNHTLPSQSSIGVMGLGEMGSPVARQLAKLGYAVSGWSRTPKQLDKITCYAGRDELPDFLQESQILICLLPLTDQTRSILDLDLIKQMKSPGWIINAARGEHLVDEDLIYALDRGLLRGAWLDVFSEEPLPDKHPFWNRPNIMITPHAASITHPPEAAEQIVDNYKRALSGLALKQRVNRTLGY